MRNLILAATMTAAASLLCAGAASAAPGQATNGLSTQAPQTLQHVDWSDRQARRLRRKGYTVVPPAPPAIAGAPVVVGDSVVVPTAPVVPVKPSSCGEYHYWNGVACVDARYHDPDLSPR